MLQVAHALSFNFFSYLITLFWQPLLELTLRYGLRQTHMMDLIAEKNKQRVQTAAGTQITTSPPRKNVKMWCKSFNPSVFLRFFFLLHVCDSHPLSHQWFGSSPSFC
ncbi:hypothetical protein R6Q59_004560 [Mikania micrantha]